MATFSVLFGLLFSTCFFESVISKEGKMFYCMTNRYTCQFYDVLKLCLLCLRLRIFYSLLPPFLLFLFIYLFISVRIVMTSINCGIEQLDGSSILISGKEVSPKEDGLNIAVYDPYTFTIISTIAFSNTKIYRFNSYFKNIRSGMIVLVTSQLLCSRTNSTDLRIHKSILYGLKKLGFEITDSTPINLRFVDQIVLIFRSN